MSAWLKTAVEGFVCPQFPLRTRIRHSSPNIEHLRVSQRQAPLADVVLVRRMRIHWECSIVPNNRSCSCYIMYTPTSCTQIFHTQRTKTFKTYISTTTQSHPMPTAVSAPPYARSPYRPLVPNASAIRVAAHCLHVMDRCVPAHHDHPILGPKLAGFCQRRRRLLELSLSS